MEKYFNLISWVKNEKALKTGVTGQRNIHFAEFLFTKGYEVHFIKL